MALFSSFLESANEVLNGLNEQPLNVNNDIDNNIHNDNANNNNDNDEKQKDQPLYKIVQEFVLETKEKDFYSLNAAVSHWESLTLLCAAIWYQWDDDDKRWKIKDSYGTSVANNRIKTFMNKKYNNNDDISRSNSIPLISYFASFSDDTGNDDNAQNSALLDDFLKWTEIYTKKSGVKPISSLDKDDENAKDLIVSLVWNVGFQCYYVHSYEMATTTWKSLGSWYASVWFTRHDTNGIFVLHENFGTSDSVRKICRFVNDSQKKWNKKKEKNIKIAQKKRPLIDNNDNNNNDDEKKETIETKENDEDDEDEDDSKLCIVCLDGDRDHIIIPCGHICICKTCKELYETDNATCPMCRGKVEKVIKTFQ